MSVPLLAALSLFGTTTDAFAQSSPPDRAKQESVWDAPEPWRTDRFFLATSLYTKHFHYSPEHDDHQHLIEVQKFFAKVPRQLERRLIYPFKRNVSHQMTIFGLCV